MNEDLVVKGVGFEDEVLQQFSITLHEVSKGTYF